jgi:hypothetical protein
MRVALGWKAHSGWAAGVALEGAAMAAAGARRPQA